MGKAVIERYALLRPLSILVRFDGMLLDQIQLELIRKPADIR
jgi:hypothetical protein